MGVSSKVTINSSRLAELSKAAITALEKTGEALHTEAVQAQVMPRDTGTLQNEKTSVDYSKSSQGKVTLVTEGPYARRLYYHPEFNFHKAPWVDSSGKNHEGNPNAKGRWLEDWLKGGKNEKFCPETFAKIYKAVAKL